MILVLLLVVWAAVLVPPYLRRRSGNGAARLPRSDGNSIANHRQQLQILDNSLGAGGGQSVNVIPFRRPDDSSIQLPVGSPVSDMVVQPNVPQVSFAGLEESPQRPVDFSTPMSLDSARRRRRNVLAALVGVAVLTLIMAVVASGAWVLVNLLADAALLAYVMLLVRHQQVSNERMNKVRPIRPAGRQPHVQPAPTYLLQQSAN